MPQPNDARSHNDGAEDEHWVRDSSAAVDDMEPATPHRRVSDHETTNDAGDGGTEPHAHRASGRRRRALLRRFRRPLIGLGMIGAAAPMTRFSGPQEPADPESDESRARRAAAAGEDAEEEVAERIGDLREKGARNLTVINAVQQFGIARDLAEDIYDVAREEGVEPRLAYGLVRTESTFRERAVSHVGARGLTQVMPRTARWLVPGTSSQDLFDRRTNLRLGFRYLDQLIDKYRGDLKLALTAYNRGPGTVDRVIASGRNPDNGYAAKVMTP